MGAAHDCKAHVKATFHCLIGHLILLFTTKRAHQMLLPSRLEYAGAEGMRCICGLYLLSVNSSRHHVWNRLVLTCWYCQNLLIGHILFSCVLRTNEQAILR